MADTLSVTHRDIEITYSEFTDSWTFKFEESSYGRQSLAEARKAVDKFLDNENKFKAKFERVAAYAYDYMDSYEPCEITSIANQSYVWVSLTKDKSRQKKLAVTVYLKNETNDALIKEIKNRKAEINALNDLNDKTRGKLQIFDIASATKQLDPK